MCFARRPDALAQLLLAVAWVGVLCTSAQAQPGAPRLPEMHGAEYELLPALGPEPGVEPGEEHRMLVRRFVFSQDDPFDFMAHIGSDAFTAGGDVVHRDRFGLPVRVPKELVAAREGLLAAKAYTDAAGLTVPINRRRRMPVFLDTDLGSSVLGSASLVEINFNAKYSPEELFSTALHEWFHVVQTQSLRVPFSGRPEHLMAVEGTAAWFEDQPIPLRPVAQRLAGAETPDGTETYYRMRAYAWFVSLSRGLFERGSRRFDPYRSVFFWKHYSDRVAGTDPDAQLAAIVSALRAIHPRGAQGNAQRRQERFKSLVAGALPGGRRSLRSHWANFLQTHIEQAPSGPRGFGDEGVKGYCCADERIETAPVEPFREHYGRGGRPGLQAEVAGSDAEIARRMNELAVSESMELKPFAMRLVAITLPGADPGNPSFDPGRTRGDPELEGVTRLFVQAVADDGQADDWVGAAVTQSRGARDARGSGIDFASKAFAIEPRRTLGGKPAARARLRWFGRKTPLAEVERLWLGFANLATDGRARTIRLQTVVTPFFQPAYGEEAGDDPRGTRTVSFVESAPEREEARFRPRDRLTLEIDASDLVHAGDGADIPEASRALELEITGPDDAALAVEDTKVWLADAAKARYRLAFTLPEEMETYGEARAQITLRSLLKLGVGDRNDTNWFFELARIPPEVVGVRVEHRGTLLHERGGDAYRPVPPGETGVRVEFDRDMDRGSQPQIRLAAAARRLPLRGSWTDARIWEGAFALPEGAAYDPFKGHATLQIQARSAEGEELDSDPEQEGAQPDERTRLLIGGAPNILRELRVRVAGEPVYEGRWEGGPDLAAAPSWARVLLGGQPRNLETRIDELPPHGAARIELVFANPLREPPTVRVGSLVVPVEEDGGEGDRYAGSFDLETAHEGLGQGAVLEVEVDAVDVAGNRLDADPRTPSLIGTDEERPWAAYEALVGRAPSGEGGPDRWHSLAAAPRMSLVIVLDLSGSMQDGGRLANAKSAIIALLDQLPHSVELALVTFNGCTPSSIGFTRDVDAIRAVVEQAKAEGSTGYAAALLMARDILATRTHPGSQILKYAPFSDGEETCDGDPIAAIDALETLIAGRRGDPPPVPVVAAAAEEDDEEIPCEPGEWEVYEAQVRSGGLHLDRIRLVETRRQERRMADGHCEVTVLQEGYGVTYGQLADGPPTWRINSRSSTKRRLQATSRDAEAERRKVEKVATQARANGSNLATTRLAIDRAVRESLTRNHQAARAQAP